MNLSRLSLMVFAILIALPAISRGDVESADALYNAGKWQDAIEAYEKALSELEGEEQARAFSQMGYAYERLSRQSDEAIEYYQKAIDAPGSTDYIKGYAYTRMGSVLMIGKRDYEKALEVLLRVEKIGGAHPNHIGEAYLMASSTAIKAGKPDLAEDLLKRMQPLVENKGATPHYLSDAYLRLGRMQADRNEYDQAIETYRKVLELPVSARQKAYAKGYIDELELLALGDLPFYIQPYTTNVGHHRAEVFWVTQGQFEPGQVTVKDDAGNIFKAASRISQIKGTACFRNQAVIEGLTPNTLYHYTVTCGDETREGRFRANPTTDQDVEVIIGVTGDTQAAPDIHLAVAKEIARDDIDFLIHVGDLTDHGSTWSKWRAELFEPAMPYLQKGPIWPAIGNHDGGPYFGILFDRSKKFWWSFDYGPVHVAILDSYWWGASRNGGRAEQLAWLEEDLKTTKAKWKIVALHVPMVATRPELDWFGEEDFLPLMENAGVDMVLSGHHPMYRKYLPLAAHSHKPIYHVTTGGGGPTGPPAPSPILEKGSEHAHGTIIKIKGDTLELTSRLTNGVVIDNFKMHKHSGGDYQSSLMEKAIDRRLAKMTRHLYFEMLEERSNKLVLGLDGALEGGKPVHFTLNTNNLPRGPLDLAALPQNTRLLLNPKTDSGWSGPEAVLPLDRAAHTFSFTAPQSVTAGGGNIKPALELEMTLQVGERRLEPFVTTVKLNQEASMQIAAATGGLPPVWDFQLDPDEVGVSQKWYGQNPVGNWMKMPVTQWWETTLGQDYDGLGWYRAKATIPSFDPKTHRIWLALGKVDESMAAYVNGKLVAEQIYNSKEDDDAWQKPRRFDVTEQLKDGENLFVVKVQDLFGMGGIYGGAMLKALPINRLEGGDMSDGLEPWKATVGSETHSLAELDLKDVAVTQGNAMYVGEKAMVVESKHEDVIKITRTFKVDPDSTHIRFGARTSGHAMGSGDGVTVNLYSGEKASGKPLVQLPVPSSHAGEWNTVSKTSQLKSDKPQAVTIEVVIGQPGRYLIDEIFLGALEE